MNSSIIIIPFIFICSALIGCAVGPDYKKPELSLPNEFVALAGGKYMPISKGANLNRWWTEFKDPLLTRLVTQALNQNLDIMQSLARVSQSRAALRIANAGLLPSGNLVAEGQKARQSIETPIGQLLSVSPDFERNGEFYDVNLGASWEADIFGELRRAKEAVRADYQASEISIAGARLIVAAQTADAYVVVRGLQERIDIARQQINIQRDLLSLVQLQFENEIASELQLNQAKGALAYVEAVVPVLNASLDASMNALSVLIGVAPGAFRTELSNPAKIPVPPGIIESGSPVDLIRRRPDIIAAERHLAASSARIGVAVSNYYPKFSLSAVFGSATTTGANLFSGDARQSQGILGLRWRLFDFGRVDAEIAAAKGRYAELLAAYRLSVLRASEDVESTLSAFIKREEQNAYLAQGVTSLQRASDTTLKAYHGGIVSLFEVLDADSKLLVLRDEKAQAQTALAQAAIASYRSLGGGWEAPQLKSVSALLSALN